MGTKRVTYMIYYWPFMFDNIIARPPCEVRVSAKGFVTSHLYAVRSFSVILASSITRRWCLLAQETDTVMRLDFEMVR